MSQFASIQARWVKLYQTIRAIAEKPEGMRGVKAVLDAQKIATGDFKTDDGCCLFVIIAAGMKEIEPVALCVAVGESGIADAVAGTLGISKDALRENASVWDCNTPEDEELREKFLVRLRKLITGEQKMAARMPLLKYTLTPVIEARAREPVPRSR